MFEFAYPWLLSLIFVVILLYFYEVYFKRRPSIKVSNVAPFSAIGGSKHPNLAQCCYLLGALLLVVALARPRFGDEKVVVRSQGIDIIIALDLSGSMEAIDVPKDIKTSNELKNALNSGEVKNRLEVAKEEIKKFIEQRPNDRIGLIGFAPLSYSFAPPTLDHGWLFAHLERLKPGIIGDATGIASPIASGVERLKGSDAPRRVLVLFTDGRNNVDNRLTPTQAAQLAKEFDVIIHTVGIGSNNAYFLLKGFGQSFQPMRDQFDAELLKSIAKVTGGNYFHAEDAEGMNSVMTQINNLEKTSIEQPKYIQYKEIAPNIAAIVIILLLLGYISDNALNLRLP